MMIVFHVINEEDMKHIVIPGFDPVDMSIQNWPFPEAPQVSDCIDFNTLEHLIPEMGPENVCDDHLVVMRRFFEYTDEGDLIIYLDCKFEIFKTLDI